MNTLHNVSRCCKGGGENSEIGRVVNGILSVSSGMAPDEMMCSSRLQDDLGLDSMDISVVAEQLREYGIEIPDEELGDLETVGDLVDYARNRV